MAPTKQCPSGHPLAHWQAEAGSCDGCRRVIRDGDLVMDCRPCNYYLCSECYNGRSSLWTSLASFIPDCTADTRASNTEEVVCDGDSDGATTEVADPRCNRRAHQASSVARGARDEEQHEESAESEEAEAPAEPLATAKSAAETVDLLGDLLDVRDAKQDAEPRSTKSAVETVDLLGDLFSEHAPQVDLDPFSAKGQEAPRQPALQAARYGAA